MTLPFLANLNLIVVPFSGFTGFGYAIISSMLTYSFVASGVGVNVGVKVFVFTGVAVLVIVGISVLVQVDVTVKVPVNV